MAAHTKSGYRFLLYEYVNRWITLRQLSNKLSDRTVHQMSNNKFVSLNNVTYIFEFEFLWSYVMTFFLEVLKMNVKNSCEFWAVTTTNTGGPEIYQKTEYCTSILNISGTQKNGYTHLSYSMFLGKTLIDSVMESWVH